MPAYTYSPPGSPTITVTASRNYNDVAMFVVEIEGGQTSPVLSWPDAWKLVLRNGGGIHTETMLRAALAEYDK